MALCWFSPKVEKRASPIEGCGLFARTAIAAFEPVAVKRGHVMTREERDRVAESLGPAEIQIAERLFIGPLTPAEREDGMLHLDHACDPNVGIQGRRAADVRRRPAVAGAVVVPALATSGNPARLVPPCSCAIKARG